MPPHVVTKRRRSISPPKATSEPPKKKVKTPIPSQSRSPHLNRDKPTLFDTADAQSSGLPTAEDHESLLRKLDDEETSENEDLSEADSDEFEDVPSKTVPKRQPRGVKKHDVDGSDEEMDWEDVEAATKSSKQQASNVISGDLELTIEQTPTYKVSSLKDASKKGPSKIERQIRTVTHQLHVQCLLCHNRIRNSWINDKRAQEILVEGLPSGIKKEVERWKGDCRKQGVNIDSTDPKPQASKKSGKKNNARDKQATRKKQRDWGKDAEQQASGGGPGLMNHAGDPLVRLMRVLSAYWRKRFTITVPGLRKQGYKEPSRLEQELKSFRAEYDPSEHGEKVTSVDDFRDAAKFCRGSRDLGAQLFTALLRGIGLEARLVANLQVIGFGWSKVEDAGPARKKKPEHAANNPRAPPAIDSDSDVKLVPNKVKNRNQSTQSRTQLSKSSSVKPQTIVLSDSDTSLSPPPSSLDPEAETDISVVETPVSPPAGKSKHYDRDLPYPHYWTEVLSPLSNIFLPVDPIVLALVASNPDNLLLFEPRGARADKGKQVIGYVVAFNADGTAKDITPRYLKRRVWPGKTKGVRLPPEKVPVYNRKGKILRHEDFDWFKFVMRCYTRSSERETLADILEDNGDLIPVKINRNGDASKKKEDVDTLTGLKSSADFVLERFLRREEALLPNAKPVRNFTSGKGDKQKTESVYLRKDVVVCRTPESWHKEGREVIPGSEPRKHVPVRAVTTQRKREIEEAERESGEKAKQAMYSKDQTDWIIPEPIGEDKIIPRNTFGNIDVYVPTMVPKGAIHIPLRGTAKICRDLGISHAEACIGFEFGNRRAVPVISGVVVPIEHEDIVIDRWEIEEQKKRDKEEEKRRKFVLNMWRKFATGLRIVEKVRLQFGDDIEDEKVIEAAQPFLHQDEKRPSRAGKKATSPVLQEADILNNDELRRDRALAVKRHLAHKKSKNKAEADAEPGEGGGFILEDDDQEKASSGSDKSNARSKGQPTSLMARHRDATSEASQDQSDSAHIAGVSAVSTGSESEADDDEEGGFIRDSSDELIQPAQPQLTKGRRTHTNLEEAGAASARTTKRKITPKNDIPSLEPVRRSTRKSTNVIDQRKGRSKYFEHSESTDSD